MSDLILTHGYFLEEDEKERKIMKPYAPLGLMYLSAFLKSLHFKVELFDTTFANRRTLEEFLSKKSSNVLGLYTNLITRSSVIRIIARAKESGFTVILGGPESANYPEQYLQHGADIIVIGAGEETLAELVTALKQGSTDNLHAIDGIIFRDAQGTLVRTAACNSPRNISNYPWPDREAVDIKLYQETWREHHGASSISMITARGCPYRCTWCSHAVYGYSHKRRSPEECADELEHIVAQFNPDHIWYADDVFTISHPWLYAYANELRKRNLKLPFETISRADRMLKPEVLDTLVDMGCYRIWIGSESGSQRILDAMHRDVTVEQVRWATRQTQARGIKVGMFLMWGYGDEQVRDIELTVEHVKQSNPDIFFTTVAYPIKGTPFFNQYKDAISLPGDWSSSTDRDFKLAFQRSPAYYQAADTYLKNAVEAERSSSTDIDHSLACGKRARTALQFLHDYESQLDRH